MSKPIKIILIHGNGDATGHDNWAPYVQTELSKLGFEVLSPDFPEPNLAKAEIWLPYLKSELKADENTILIGHSSGAVAAMRFAEENKLLGSVLIGVYYTTLGMESEKLSGYFDKPWDWQAISNNQQWIIKFASTDDPYIPIEDARYVQQKLNAKYFEFTDQGHFGQDIGKTEFPELVDAVITKINS